MMPWRAAALMAMTFCMTVSRVAAWCGASLRESVNERRFPDFCTKTGKWFRARGDLFRRRLRDETYAAKL
jgi:hypothetical protein